MATPQPGTHRAERGARRLPVLQGLLPTSAPRILPDIVAGLALAAVAIPTVMGYTRIAGTPIVTGLYTLLLPMALFALFGSSRHLVVSADSATAALMASEIAILATPNSPEWLGLTELLAMMAAAFLLLARIVRLAFLVDFLSRTVLTGFLAGVGLQVALGEVPGLLGLSPQGHDPLGRLTDVAQHIDQAKLPVMLVSGSVIAVILGARTLPRRVPGALIAVAGAIAASWLFNLQAHGVPVLGRVPQGLPDFGLPQVPWSLDLLRRLTPTALAITLVILAQSAATSRAYAVPRAEPLDENADLVGLSLANLGAALSGTFVVNGSPTKTQAVVDAGGSSQLAQLVTCVATGLVLLLLTGPLALLPRAVLSAVVFLIGMELIDLPELRRILEARPVEFAIAGITAAIVLLVGVQHGIVAAMVLSLLVHVREGYRPKNAVLAEDHGEPRPVPVATRHQLRPGLIVYRFNHSMYYANAAQLAREVTELVQKADPAPRWFCFDMAAVDDVDYSAGETLHGLITTIQRQGSRATVAELGENVRADLQRYGILALLGPDAVYGSIGGVMRAYERQANPSAGPSV